MPSPDDLTLWQNAAAGDPDSFGLLFDRHANAIYNFCFRRTGSWATAEDLTSVVFLEAWRRRDVKLEPGMVLPWLYGVATNVVRNRRRSERRHEAAMARLAGEASIPDFADAVSESVDSERAMRQILAILRKLPKREQDVFVLCGWCDLSYEEAAVALRIPIGTVRSRLSRARGRLRELSGDCGHIPSRTALEGAPE